MDAGSERYLTVGFTGTRHGLTDLQRDILEVLLETLAPARLRHGDCAGADAAAHEAARRLGIAVSVHAPDNPALRARCDPGPQGEVLPPRPYAERNRAIVALSDVLAACPDGPERPRSGTWMTVRFARKLGKRVFVIYPDGRVDEEGIDVTAEAP